MNSKYYSWILLFFLLIFWFLMFNIPPILDSAKNYQIGKSFLAGTIFHETGVYYGQIANGFMDSHPPLISIISALFPIYHNFQTFYLFTLIIFLLILLIFYLKTKDINSLLLFILSPVVILLFPSIMDDHFTFIFLTIGYLFFKSKSKSLDSFIAAIFFTLATFTSYFVIFFLIILIFLEYKQNKKLYISLFIPLVLIGAYLLLIIFKNGLSTIIFIIQRATSMNYKYQLNLFQRLILVPINFGFILFPILFFIPFNHKKIFLITLINTVIFYFIFPTIFLYLLFFLSLYSLYIVFKQLNTYEVTIVIVMLILIIILNNQPVLRNFSIIFPVLLVSLKDKIKLHLTGLIFLLIFNLLFIISLRQYTSIINTSTQQIIKQYNIKKALFSDGIVRYIIKKRKLKELLLSEIKKNDIFISKENLLYYSFTFKLKIIYAYIHFTPIPIDIFNKGTTFFYNKDSYLPIYPQKSYIRLFVYKALGKKQPIMLKITHQTNINFNSFSFLGFSYSINKRINFNLYFHIKKFKDLTFFIHCYNNKDKLITQTWHTITKNELDPNGFIKITLKIPLKHGKYYLIVTNSKLKPIYPQHKKNYKILLFEY